MVTPSGEVDRSAIARLVFADEAERRWLESLLLPRVSVDVSYNRRWWNNFFTTHNAALVAADWDQVTLTAPGHPDLPGGG